MSGQNHRAEPTIGLPVRGDLRFLPWMPLHGLARGSQLACEMMARRTYGKQNRALISRVFSFAITTQLLAHGSLSRI